MAYGTAHDVASFVPRYTDSGGEFTFATRPTNTAVDLWLTQVSGVLDTYLASKGYSVPVTDANFAAALDMFTAEEVAAMAEGVNGSGRFGPTAPDQRAQSRFAIIRKDVTDFIDSLLIGNETQAGSSAVTREDGYTVS